jgi:hypothetical protein
VKFLIISKMKDAFCMIPVDKQAQIMEGNFAFVDKYRKAGILREIYSIPSIHGTITVWDVESGEKGGAIFAENPGYGFQDYEMYAISDFDAQMKVQNEIYQRLLGKK